MCMVMLKELMILSWTVAWQVSNTSFGCSRWKSIRIQYGSFSELVSSQTLLFRSEPYKNFIRALLTMSLPSNASINKLVREVEQFRVQNYVLGHTCWTPSIVGFRNCYFWMLRSLWKRGASISGITIITPLESEMRHIFIMWHRLGGAI